MALHSRKRGNVLSKLSRRVREYLTKLLDNQFPNSHTIFLDVERNNKQGFLSLEVSCYKLPPNELMQIRDTEWTPYALFIKKYGVTGVDLKDEQVIENFAIQIMCEVQKELDMSSV